MDFKDRMIEAIENGLTTEENAYDYVRESMADSADQRRKADKETCPTCGQPDNCGDCDHTPVFMVGDRVVWDDGDEQGAFNGTITRADFGAPVVMVKLDVGGTFSAQRRDLKRLP